MKILLAPDKFKGSLSAQEVCYALEAGLKTSLPASEITLHPLADGGDGSIDILMVYLGLTQVSLTVSDPLGRKIKTHYYASEDAAYVEVAAASGLTLLDESERNPMPTSTFGTGELIRHAVQSGLSNIYLFLGGSATNDAGLGIAAALGFVFLDEKKNSIQPQGDSLLKIHQLDDAQVMDLSGVKFHLISDVKNPLLGPQGAAQVYAAQKGASTTDIVQLEKGMEQVADLIEKKSGKTLRNIPGSGAAGGIGLAMLGLFGAEIQSGIQAIMDWTNFETTVKSVDLVISGEGKLDEQSLEGKVIKGVADLCQKHGKPLALFVGKNELSKSVADKLSTWPIQEISALASDEQDAMAEADFHLMQLAEKFAKAL